MRPEDVLEKALLMVHNSQKTYLYKCDQLKSIRQDLTVQRIRNELTVKVYFSHMLYGVHHISGTCTQILVIYVSDSM